jgi:hypothetical protein
VRVDEQRRGTSSVSSWHCPLPCRCRRGSEHRAWTQAHWLLPSDASSHLCRPSGDQPYGPRRSWWASADRTRRRASCPACACCASRAASPCPRARRPSASRPLPVDDDQHDVKVPVLDAPTPRSTLVRCSPRPKMEVIKLDLLASLPAYSPQAEGSYLGALGKIVDAPPTAVHPSERAGLLSWLVGGLQEDVWSDSGASQPYLRAPHGE